MKRVTMADVAELASVSKSTVSAVVNDKDSVRESTRQRVLAAIDQLGYRLNRNTFPSSRTFARRRKSIGFVIKESANPYYMEALAGVQEAAREAGYLVFLSNSEGDYDTEQEIVKHFAACEFDGLIIVPMLDERNDLSYLFELKQTDIPFVLLAKVWGLGVGVVDINNVPASSLAVKHLIELGHEHIIHLAGPKYSRHTTERTEGVRRAFSESQLVFDEGTVIPAGNSINDGYRAGLDYFTSCGDDRPTAVTCYNDLVALGLFKALHELNLRVPEDVSVVGFDDLSMLDCFPVPLTTMRVPKIEMGRRAAKLLIQQVEGNKASSQEQIYLDAELVVRSSTSSPIADAFTTSGLNA